MVYVTCGAADEAGRLAALLVENRLAACVNIVDAVSVYRWREKIEKENEKLLIIKTVESRFKELERLVKDNHSYECPEIIAQKIVAGSVEYLEWVRTAVNEKCSLK
jgi:uncharacterized protein involved in tolerance to divalent cations